MTVKDYNYCSGCRACELICPKSAIAMHPDEKGFFYPDADTSLCLQCNLCMKICPFHEGFSYEENLPQPEIYAVKHRYDSIRLKSSSGGMFTAISDKVIKQGGIVYGAAFNEDFSVSHGRAETRPERDRFCGSKYVQSDLKTAFSAVREDLQNGKKVLFTGTPCQTAGLYRFLKYTKTSLDGLLLCDLICHGVPSQKIFTDYRNFLEKKYRSPITSFIFRYKPAGWRAEAMKAVFQNGRKYIGKASEDPFYHLFLSNIILRESCYHCPFTSFHRPSDITIGDFWGIENSEPEFMDEKGVSLVLVNTEKGRKLFESVSNSLDVCVSNPQSCSQLHNLYQPTVPSPLKDPFWSDYRKYGFEYSVRKYGGAGWKGQTKTGIKRILRTVGLYEASRKLLKKV